MSSDGMISGIRSRPRSQGSYTTIAVRQGLGRVVALGPTALWYILFFLAPLSLMVRYSLAFTTDARLEFVWTPENYVRIVSDPLYLSLLWRSLRLAALVTLICVLIGYPAAWALAHASD